MLIQWFALVAASGGIALEATGVAQPDSARMSKRLQSVENIRKLADARVGSLV